MNGVFVFDKIHGLPGHVLLIHLVVVILPMAALMLIASAVWPAARAKLGVLTPAAALVALILVPITTDAGHYLQDHLPNNFGQSAQVRHHAALGENLLPWAVGIFVMAAAVWILGRRFGLSWRGSAGGAARALPVWVTALVAALSIVVAVGGTIQLYRIGDSGARSVWGGTLSH
jgi:hypothetical protein